MHSKPGTEHRRPLRIGLRSVARLWKDCGSGGARPGVVRRYLMPAGASAVDAPPKPSSGKLEPAIPM
jgi:hypothetical protein